MVEAEHPTESLTSLDRLIVYVARAGTLQQVVADASMIAFTMDGAAGFPALDPPDFLVQDPPCMANSVRQPFDCIWNAPI